MSVINTNVKSLVAQASLAANSKNQATAMERLSTGSRINSAKDDAAGLAIGSRMTSQVRGLNMAIRNANDGISLAQTAEGALDETTSMLQRMRELSVQAANGVNNASDRAALNAEVQQLKTEIDRIASTTKFNGQNVLDGSMNATLQIGDQVGQSMQLAVGNMATAAMGETASGLATSATRASLTVSGGAASAAAYQGVSFDVSVNGVATTVALPAASPTVTSPATAAAAQVGFVGNDRAVSTVTSGQAGSIAEQTVDVSAAANKVLTIAVNGGVTQSVSIASAITAAGYTATAMTGDQMVSVLQTALDANASFTGANALTVGKNANEQITLSLTSGAAGSIALSTATGASQTPDGLLYTLGGSHVGESSATGSITIGAAPKTLDLTGGRTIIKMDTTTGSTVNQDIDLASELTILGVDMAAVTGAELKAAFDAYKVTYAAGGASADLKTMVSTLSATVATDGTFTLATSDGAAKFTDHTTAATKDLMAALGTADGLAGASIVSTAFKGNVEKFGQADLAISSANANNTLVVQVGSQLSVSMTLADATYDDMTELATAVQSKMDSTGAFLGANAITVSATTNASGGHGLTFASANGSEINISGNFLTDAQGLNHSAARNEGNVVATSSAVKVTSLSYAPQALSQAQRTVNLGTDALKEFTLNVNGIGAKSLSVKSAITAAGYTDTAMTGAQLVEVLNTTIAADSNFQGNNAVTAALDSDGYLTMTVSGGSKTIVMGDSATGLYDTLITAGGGSSGVATAVNGVQTIKDTGASSEVFGETDLVVGSSTNSLLSIKVGSEAAVSITIDAATYDDMDALVTQINSKIVASGLFTGTDALTASKVTDASGNTGFSLASATGNAITLQGDTSTGLTTSILAANEDVVFPGARVPTGGVDLSADNQVTLSVADADGSLVSRTLTLGSSVSNVSFSDYAGLLQTAANTDFAANGYSFTVSEAGGQISMALDQAGAKTMTLSGTSVSAALGGNVSASGVAQVVSSPGNVLNTMDDVVVAVNEDLAAAGAQASYSASTGAWTFEATTGNAGTGNTIALSGAGLSSVQLSASSATGAAGDATAVRLSTITVDTIANANAAVNSIDNAIEYVNSQRSSLGAIQNRLDHTVSNLTNISTNTEASRSRIMDADYGQESAALAKAQIIQQAATAMLAQANQSSQSVLSLLQ